MFSVQLYAFLATKEYNYANVTRWVRGAKIDWPSTLHILIPVHVNKNHYVLVDVDLRNAKVVMFDSRQRSRWDREHVLFNVRCMVQDALDAEDITRWIIKRNVLVWALISETTEVPQQKDGSCGVYVCGFAACLAAKVTFIFAQADISCMRKRIGLAVLDGIPRRRRSRRVQRESEENTDEVQVVSASIPREVTTTSPPLDSSSAHAKLPAASEAVLVTRYTVADIVWFYTRRLPSMNPWLSMPGQSISHYVSNRPALQADHNPSSPQVNAWKQSPHRIVRVLRRPPPRSLVKSIAVLPKSKSKPSGRSIIVPDDPPPRPDTRSSSQTPQRRRHQARRIPAFVQSLRRNAEAETRTKSPDEAKQEPLPLLDVTFTTHIPVLSHVPHGARTQVRDALSSVLSDFNFANTEPKACDALTRLYAFAPCLLAAPPGHRRTSTSGKVSLSAPVKGRVRMWNGKAYGQL